MIDPIPQEQLVQPLAQLGQALFRDIRVSSSGRTSCASCHLADDGGADRRHNSLDAKGKHTARNSQTVSNDALQPMLRWAGDRKSAAQQAEKSLTGSMRFDSAEAVVPLLNELGYRQSFQIGVEDEAAAIESFLHALSGDVPENYRLPSTATDGKPAE